MIAWLKCSIEPGMFSAERAVSIETLNAGIVSLFAQVYQIKGCDLLSVEVLRRDDTGVLVRLPAYPYEVASRNVWVDRGRLE